MSPRREGNPRGARTKLAIVAAVAGAAAAGFVAWSLRDGPGMATACTVTATLGQPTATSPQKAFDAWWQHDGQDGARLLAGLRNTDSAEQPHKADFKKVSGTRWEWRYADDRALAVDVSHPAAGDTNLWAVTGINRCTIQPA